MSCGDSESQGVVEGNDTSSANDFFIEQDLLQRLIGDGDNVSAMDVNDDGSAFLPDTMSSMTSTGESVGDEFVSADVDTLDLTDDVQQPAVDVLDQSQLEQLLGPDVKIDQELTITPQGNDQDEDSKEEGKTPKRRSQRQMEREMKEEADRIRTENQQRMKQEADEAAAKNRPQAITPAANSKGTTLTTTVPVSKAPVAPSGRSRPKRERKVPAHLRDNDFETSLIKHGQPQVKSNKEEQEVIQDSKPEQKELRTTEDTNNGPEKSDSVPKEVGVEEDKKSNVESDKKVEDEDDDDDESMSDWNSEDDPDRLWCVCQQPHNNRFMICCDSCLDWYHGKCVGITKAMGKAMEEAGNEWRCPKCKTNIENAEEEKRRNSLQKTLKEREKDKDGSKSIGKSTTSPTATTKTSITTPPSKEKKVLSHCFECEKAPSLNSLFCSEACILKHVFKAQHRLRASSNKHADDHIMVMDPKANTMLTGPNAPTIDNLEEWMKMHPSYHVVMPPSIPKSSKKTGSSSTVQKAKPSATSTTAEKALIDQKLAEYHKAAKEVSLSRLNAAKKSLQNEERLKSFKEEEHRRTSTSTKHQVATPVHRKETSATPRRHSSSSSSKMKGETVAAPQPFVDPEPIRDNCREGLFEALKKRVEKANDVKIEDSNLKQLVNDIEIAMFKLNHGDVGSKYKNKYRSLHFNISDEKNLGLFRKIVRGKIVPKQLVSMTPGELANKELQEWREKELKEDIEKIKSHELDMISQGHKLLLKSHKGEQIIETDDNTEVQLPEEIDLKESETKPFTAHHKLDASEAQLDVDRISLDKRSRKESKSKEDKDRRRHKKRSRDKKEDEHSSRHRSSSHKHRHHHHHKHKKSSSKRDDEEAKKEIRRDFEGKDSTEIKDKEETKKIPENEVKTEHTDKGEKASTKPFEKKNKEGALDAAETHNSDQLKLVSPSAKSDEKDTTSALTESDIPEPSLSEVSVTDSKEESFKTPSSTDPDKSIQKSSLKTSSSSSEAMDEVSSTVQILTPPQSYSTQPSLSTLWQGALNMPDVANFGVNAFSVSGSTDYLDVDLKSPLKIVGRIGPEAVFEYMSQVAENGHKEIVVLRLQPQSKSGQANYDAFFDYLASRNRFGVVGNADKMVKDCYIAFLKSEQSLHKSLKVTKGDPGLEEQRPNLLLALVVRARRKRKAESDSRKHAVDNKKRMTHKVSEVTSVEDDDSPYDPATAGFDEMDDEEEYDPESASFDVDFDDGENSETSKTKLYSDPNDPRFSPPETDAEMQRRTKSDEMTYELERITKQIEESKKELEGFQSRKKSETGVELPGLGSDQAGPVAGFQSLPSSIASILFNVVPDSKEGDRSDDTKSDLSTATRDPRRPFSSSTTSAPSTSAVTETTTSMLGSMSGDDLVAKAQAMMREPPRPSPWLHPAPQFSQQPAFAQGGRGRDQNERRHRSSRPHSRHGGRHFHDDHRDRRDRRHGGRDRRRDERRHH